MKTIFVKRNDEYGEPYRLKTQIVQLNEKRYVVKKALTIEAKDHLLNMYNGQEYLKKYYTNLEICSSWFEEEGLWFDFIEGKPLTKKFIEALESNNELLFYDTIEYYVSLILGNEENQCAFAVTDDFINFFGDIAYPKGLSALKFVPFDITSNNIIISNYKKPVLIDYEWCFNFPIPRDFIIYRCINNLYQMIPDFKTFIPINTVLSRQNITIEKSILNSWWEHFYNYIIRSEKSSKNHFDIIGNYAKKRISIYESNNKINNELLEARRYISEYEKITKLGFKEKDKYIAELEEQMSSGFAEKDKYIAELEEQMSSGFAEKDKYIAELEEQMSSGFAEKDKYIAELEKQMSSGFVEKDKYIAELEEQMSSGFAEKDKYIAELEEQMSSGFAEKDKYIAELEEQMSFGFAEKDKYINKAEKDIVYLKKIITEKEEEQLELELKIQKLDESLSVLRRKLLEIESSFWWKLLKKFHKK